MMLSPLSMAIRAALVLILHLMHVSASSADEMGTGEMGTGPPSGKNCNTEEFAVEDETALLQVRWEQEFAEEDETAPLQVDKSLVSSRPRAAAPLAACPELPAGTVACSDTLGASWLSTTSITNDGFDPSTVCRDQGYDGARSTKCASSASDACTINSLGSLCTVVKEDAAGGGTWDIEVINRNNGAKAVTWHCSGTKTCSAPPQPPPPPPPCPALPTGTVDCGDTDLGANWLSTTSITNDGFNPTAICESQGYEGARSTKCASSASDACTINSLGSLCTVVKEDAAGGGTWDIEVRNRNNGANAVTWYCAGTKTCPGPGASPSTTSTTTTTMFCSDAPTCPCGYQTIAQNINGVVLASSNAADMESCASLCSDSCECWGYEFSSNPGYNWNTHSNYKKCYTFTDNHGTSNTQASGWQTCKKHLSLRAACA